MTGQVEVQVPVAIQVDQIHAAEPPLGDLRVVGRDDLGHTALLSDVRELRDRRRTGLILRTDRRQNDEEKGCHCRGHIYGKESTKRSSLAGMLDRRILSEARSRCHRFRREISTGVTVRHR
jgi:hypothetical protein